MRIRTVKPEFWSHPVTGRWSGELQAFALSLLNVVDDDGYFYADPVLVRSAVRPFDEDSKNVRRMLQELECDGWIEVIEHPSRGSIGRIPTFAKHQHINKPTKSAIATYFEESLSKSVSSLESDNSGSTTGTLPEHYRNATAWKGKERKGKEQGKEGKGTEIETAPARPMGPAAEDLVQLWNTEAAEALPRCNKLTDARRRSSNARLGEHGLPKMREVIHRINASDFCRGVGGKSNSWVASYDWLIQPDVPIKVLEGKYDNRPGTGPPNGANSNTEKPSKLLTAAETESIYGGARL